jgi:hypothetical protein
VCVRRLRVVVPSAPAHKDGAERTAAQFFDRCVPAIKSEKGGGRFDKRLCH